MFSTRITIEENIPTTILRRNSSSLFKIFNDVSLPSEVTFDSISAQLRVGINRLNSKRIPATLNIF
jgi:hypothetical protein